MGESELINKIHQQVHSQKCRGFILQKLAQNNNNQVSNAFKTSDKNSSNDEDDDDEDVQSLKTDKSPERADDQDFEEGFYVKKKPQNLSTLQINTTEAGLAAADEDPLIRSNVVLVNPNQTRDQQQQDFKVSGNIQIFTP